MTLNLHDALKMDYFGYLIHGIPVCGCFHCWCCFFQSHPNHLSKTHLKRYKSKFQGRTSYKETSSKKPQALPNYSYFRDK